MDNGTNVADFFQQGLKGRSNGLFRPIKLRFYPVKGHYRLCKRLYRLSKYSGIVKFPSIPYKSCVAILLAVRILFP